MNRKGTTLVEVLIVIAIIALLAALMTTAIKTLQNCREWLWSIELYHYNRTEAFIEDCYSQRYIEWQSTNPLRKIKFKRRPLPDHIADGPSSNTTDAVIN